MRDKLLFVAMGLTSLTSVGGQNSPAADGVSAQSAPTNAVPAHVKAPDIQALLKNLEQAPVPQARAMGAMCYKPALPPERVEYVCPTCGNKTLHATRKEGKMFDRSAPALAIQACRSLVAQLKQRGLDIKLDESSLCDACKKDGVEALAIEVVYQGKKTRCSLKGADDLRKLQAFLDGQLVWKGGRDAEHPLKPELPRIRELLGVIP